MVRMASTLIFEALRKEGLPHVRMSELVDSTQYGHTASASSELVGPKFVRITDIQDGKINWSTVPYCRCSEVEKYLLRENDILFARTGATTGKTFLVQTPCQAVFASYLIRVRPNNSVLPEYLHSFFQSDTYWSQVLEKKHGSAQPNVNARKLANIRLPNINIGTQISISRFLEVVRARQEGSREEFPELPPPISEQRRVVSKIEELAAKIQEAQELRQQAIIEVDSLIAAEVASIFSQGKQKGWGQSKLGNYLLDSCYGTSEKTNNDSSGTPILRMGNIQDGQLNFNNLKYLHIDARDRSNLILKKGDILINRTNSAELVGKCAVFDAEGEFGFASYLIKLSVDTSRANPYLIALYINSPSGRNYMLKKRKQMTGQANISATRLKALPIALPDLTEQQRILDHLNGLQHKVDSLKCLQADTANELSELLPSILGKALKGELQATF